MDGLPQLAHGVFLTDSGLETDLIFHHGYDLPSFAAFVLLEDEAGRERLRRYYREHAAVAGDVGVGFVAGGAHVAGQRRAPLRAAGRRPHVDQIAAARHEGRLINST